MNKRKVDKFLGFLHIQGNGEGGTRTRNLNFLWLLAIQGMKDVNYSGNDDAIRLAKFLSGRSFYV